ncbi:MAG: 3-deoxy-D-manno-octulosonic acid transferase [Alphaproteobacteria bacterium]|nr:3-deoxy-D-manno-octulosonic acid transferase [Alphaproteobacteria bacterium]
MLLGLYKIAMQASAPLLEAYLQKRSRAGKEDPARAHERRGRPQLPRPAAPLVWFHAASVGESLSLLALVTRVRRDYPLASVMVTTGTVTSAALMAQRLPEGAFHQYLPVDHPAWVAGFLDHWRPDAVFWAESELWPNMLSAAHARGIPAVLLNARMSQESFKRWRYARGAIKQVLGAFTLCLAQNKAEAERLRALGGGDVRVSANLKYAAASLPYDAAVLAEMRARRAQRPAILWASTHAGEETRAFALHQTFCATQPDFLTVIVPRHPARAGEIMAEAATLGISVARRSSGQDIPAGGGIYLADTMGELGLFYRLCPFVVMGGTFADIGGHNPIEPAQAGCTVFWGPVGYNFLTVLDDFRAAQALVEVADEKELVQKITAALQSPQEWQIYGVRAAAMTAEKATVLDGIMADIAPVLQSALARADQQRGAP